MKTALASRHMGRIIAAYRTHPFHDRVISQTVVGAWVGLSQTEISRLETGPPVKDMDKLVYWARVLQIPPDLLWFKLPEDRASPTEPPATIDNPSEAGLAPEGFPPLRLDELRRLAVALEDARHLDTGSIRHLERQLSVCATVDGSTGPARTLPRILGLLAILEHQARRVRPTVRRDLIRLGARAAELAGWLYRDLGAASAAEHWRDRAFEWAAEANDLPMCGYVLLRKSQAAWDQRDAPKMLALADAADDGPWELPPKVRAEVAQQQARGHAMLGSHPQLVARNLEQAWALLDDPGNSAPGPGETLDPLGAGYTPTLLTLQTGICHTEAGQTDKAIATYRTLLISSDFSPRDHGYFLALLALAFQQADEPREAARTGLDALATAQRLSSRRTLAELRRLGRGLSAWNDLPEVREFLEALAVA
jgi:hypothetical protein